jgi:hypothetical protein
MHNHGIVGADPQEIIEGLAAGDQIIFSERLEPIYRRALSEDGLVVLLAQSEAEAEKRTREFSRHDAGCASCVGNY